MNKLEQILYLKLKNSNVNISIKQFKDICNSVYSDAFDEIPKNSSLEVYREHYHYYLDCLISYVEVLIKKNNKDIYIVPEESLYADEIPF